MKSKVLLVLMGIEIFIIVYGICAFAIANYFITKQDLELIKERQKGLKIQMVYKNCPYANENERNEKE